MTYATLPRFRFTHGATMTQAQPPKPGTVTLDSPALSVMTDLATVRAATIPAHASLSQAEAEMMHQGVRLLFVVKELAGVDGVVTLTDLLGDKPLMLVHQRNMKHQDIIVADVMTRLGDLDGIEEASLRQTSVGHVVATLLKFGHPYLFVIEAGEPGTPTRIRGLISASQVERQLGAPLPTLPSFDTAATFAEVTRALGER